MNKFIKQSTAWILILVLVIFAPSFAKSSETNADKIQIPITAWLKIGPIESSMPVFHNIKNIKGKEFDLKSLLQFEQFEINKLLPQEGQMFNWDQSTNFQWTGVKADSEGLIFDPASEKDLPQFMYLISYIDAKRWTKAKLEVTSHHLFQVYLDGEKITEKTSSEQPKDDTTTVDPGKASHELKLETGKHLLFIKSLKDPINKSEWSLKAELQLSEPWNEYDLDLNTSPKHNMTIEHLLDGPKIGNVSISPDGELVALSIRQTLPPTDNSETWIELRRANDGSLLNT